MGLKDDRAVVIGEQSGPGHVPPETVIRVSTSTVITGIEMVVQMMEKQREEQERPGKPGEGV